MPQYRYTAQDSAGKKQRGIMNAADETELHALLKNRGLMMLSSTEKSDGRTVRQLSSQTLAEFSKELAGLLNAGITLVRAISIIADGEAVKPREKKIYLSVLAMLKQGTALSDAMEAQGSAFPPLMISMYRAAETTGNLAGAASRMGEIYVKEHKLNSRISTSLTYPKILTVMIVIVIIILTEYVIPRFEDMFMQMEHLPTSTRILLAVSSFVKHRWLLLIVLIIALWFLWHILMMSPPIKRFWYRIRLHVPLFGRLQKSVYTARFTRTLSSLYASGIPIVTALQIARDTIGNPYIEKQFDEVIPAVRSGIRLSDALGQVDGFTKKMTDSVRVGEETGSLDIMLTSISETLEYDSDAAINKMVSYVEPVMLLVMGAIVAFVMLSVFSAIYGSYSSISGLA